MPEYRSKSLVSKALVYYDSAHTYLIFCTTYWPCIPFWSAEADQLRSHSFLGLFCKSIVYTRHRTESRSASSPYRTATRLVLFSERFSTHSTCEAECEDSRKPDSIHVEKCCWGMPPGRKWNSSAVCDECRLVFLNYRVK